MAFYENGILISGANTLPQMTLAEYQALPASERPTYWERTDLNYSNIPASDVTYGSGSVEDALDDAKIFYKDIPIAGIQISGHYASIGTGVNLSQYEAIGMTEGPVNITEVTVSVYRGGDNQYRLMLRSTIASTTLSSSTSPIRVLFVKKSQLNPTPLS